MNQRSAELLRSLPGFLASFEGDAVWDVLPICSWLARVKKSWKLKGQGTLFEEMRRAIPRAGSSYELSADLSSGVDLLALDGPLSAEQENPAYWAASLGLDAVVVLGGIHPGTGASLLWRRWCEARPAPAVFRSAVGTGIAILLPVPQFAPAAVRELCEAECDIAALFDAIQKVAERSKSAICNAEATHTRALAKGLRLSQEIARAEALDQRIVQLSQELARADALAQQIALLPQERARADAVAQQIALLESSTTYRFALALRLMLSWLPAPMRTLLRRLAKLVWWTMRGRLPEALRARRELQRRTVPGDAHAIITHAPSVPQLPGERVRSGEFDPEPSKLPAVCQAVLPPSELDVSLAVPVPGACQTQNAGLRVAVILHLYYDDLAEGAHNVLMHIHVPCDLYITTDSAIKRAAILRAFHGWQAGSIDVRVLPNSGRDVGPMMEVLADVMDGYDLILHIHGKKSVHCGHGSAWRNYMYEILCGSPSIVATVFSAFSASPKLGIIFPQHWEVVRPAISWGYSFDDANDLASRMGIDLQLEQPLDFSAGFMFWARPAALKPLAALNLSTLDFVEGAGGSSFAHAIERLLLRVCEHSGHTWLKIARTDMPEIATPCPLTVGTLKDLPSQIARNTYLLSDPALGSHDHSRYPWRFNPDACKQPRLTLIAERGWPTKAWDNTSRALASTIECRIEMIPRSGPGIQQSISVRSHEVFVVVEEACMEVALGLVRLQRRFFGHASRVQILPTLDEPDIIAALRAVGIDGAGAAVSRREETLV